MKETFLDYLDEDDNSDAGELRAMIRYSMAIARKIVERHEPTDNAAENQLYDLAKYFCNVGFWTIVNDDSDPTECALFHFTAGMIARELEIASGTGKPADTLLFAYRQQLEARTKGGRRGKLTDELKAIAQEVVNAKCRGTSVTFTAACDRAAGVLLDEHQFKFSGRRLRDVLSDPTLGSN